MKKALSLALALALCLGLTAPAFAADTLTGSQLYPDNWGDGSSLTLTGVVGEVETPIDPSYLYDVEVGGSLVLEMTYPAGKNRSYSIMIGGFYITPDFSQPDDNDKAAWDVLGATWDLAGSVQGGDFDESSGQTSFVYTFTEADMGQKNGFDKIIYPHIYWCDDANNDGMVDEGAEGSAYFGIRVVPAEEETSASYQVSDWAKDRVALAVETGLAAEGLGSDYRVNITRAQFAATAVKLYEAMGGQVDPAGENPFNDTTDSVIIQAAELGFVSGVGGGRFSPDALVTREQAAVMLSSVFTKLGGAIPAVDATTFADNAAVSGWARNAVAFMADKGIVSGVGNNNFGPQGNASIEQALLIALKMFEDLK